MDKKSYNESTKNENNIFHSRLKELRKAKGLKQHGILFELLKIYKKFKE